MPSTNGTHYGGNYTLNLQPYSNNWDYSYYDWWYWWYGTWVHYWGNNHDHSGYGYGTTTW